MTYMAAVLTAAITEPDTHDDAARVSSCDPSHDARLKKHLQNAISLAKN